MFSNLVESGSHKRDLKRRGSFFLGTLVFYGVLVLAAGVGSIYAYNVRLDDPNDDEIVTLMNFARTREEKAEPVRQKAATKPAQQQGGGGKPQIAVVTEVAKISPHLSHKPVASETSRALPDGMDYKIGDHNFIPPAGFGGGTGDGKPGNSDRKDGPVVEDGPDGGGAPPRIVKPQPTPAPKPEQRTPVRLTSEVLTGKAISKPVPPYSAAARIVRAQGPVVVQVVVDEQGRVLSAKATNGHPLLRNSAEQAALRARFTPTMLGGQPVRVTGVITYNFVLQ